MVLAAVSGWSGPIFLGVAADDAVNAPVSVLAGQTTEFALTLSSAEIEVPQLSGDLAVVAGGLTAPLASNISFELQRAGEAHAGIQRFKFSLEIPATKQKQRLLLRTKVRSGGSGNWLPLPPVLLQAVPPSWKESMRLFANQVPIGRLADGEKLKHLFQQLEIEVVEMPDGEPVTDQSVRVWFAETSNDQFQLPVVTGCVWVVFKKNARGGLELRRSTPEDPLCVVVEADILDRLDSDPAAQDLLERALSMARTLLPVSIHP